MSNKRLTQSPSWLDLLAHTERLAKAPLKDLLTETGRHNEFSTQACGLVMDFSRQHLDRDSLQSLLSLAEERQLETWRAKLFAGKTVNNTENRAAMHMALRATPDDDYHVDGEAVLPTVHAELDRIEQFVDAIHQGKHTGSSGKPLRQVVNIGIGGSDLGPAVAWQALHGYAHPRMHCHFVSAIDGQDLHDLKLRLDPAETLFIICSKSFATQETMANAQRARAWLTGELGETAVAKQMAAVSSNHEAMDDFGIDPKLRFSIWDWVGGRFSLWSAVGLALTLGIGMEHFRAMLTGARAMDRHFRDTPLSQNLPVLAALIDVWNINFQDSHSLVVLPYTQRLIRLPEYLQQLFMESLGKSTTRDGQPVTHRTGAMLWGGAGSNAQHAFMQLLHQGTESFATEFLVPVDLGLDDAELDSMNQSNALAQAEALAVGCDAGAHSSQPGNHPSTVIAFESVTPEMFGSLLAFYEHRVFSSAIIWGINAFDQFGVELGKKLAKEMNAPDADSGLLDWLRGQKD